MAIADFVVKHGATVNELATFNSTTDATSTSSAALTVAGGVGIAKSLIVGGSINTTSTAASSVAWTTSGVNLKLPARTYTDTTSISAVPASYVNTVLAPTFASTNVITIANAANLFVDAPVAGTNSTLTNAWAIYANGKIRASEFTGTIGVTTASSGAFTTLSASGQITSTLAIGTAPFVVTSTTNVANLNASSLSGATFAAPGAIGSTTASTGKFTTVESTVATGTAPFIVASTTNVANLNASLLNGSTFAAPSAIGSTTANTGTFTTLSTTGNLTIGGNLTVNGTTVTLNSSTITVDDKNLELGSVATVLPTGNITAGSAIVTNLSSTANIIIGSAVSAISGAVNVTLPAGVTVLTIDSATQITLSAVFTGTGSATGATLTIGGATDTTANGGGITLLGATNKTVIWDSANSNWTSSENWNIATGKTYKINNVPVLTANSVLNDATQTSVTVGGNATTLNLGAVGSGNTYVNTSSLYVGGATLLTTASAGIEVGSGRTGDGFAFIDLVGDATYTDYGARFVRSGTANGLTKIVTRGTGGLVLETNEAGSISFNTSATTRMTIDSSGQVGIGGAPVTGATLSIRKNITGAVNSYGLLNYAQIQSDVTTNANIYQSQTSTQATAFTLSNLRHFYANQDTFGANSIVTNQTGFSVESTLVGAVNNFGFYGGLNYSAGTNRFNLYMGGTADNYLAGNLLLNAPQRFSGSGGSWFWIDNVNTTTLRFSSGASAGTAGPMYFTDSGNLGIGVAPGTTKLAVTSTIAKVASFTTTVTASPANNDAEEIFSIINNAGIANLTFAAGDSRLLTFGVATDNSMYMRAQALSLISTAGISFNPSQVQKMYLDSNGNLGIGASTPTSKLHVRSDANALTVISQLQNRTSGANTGATMAFITSANDISDNRYAYIGAVTTGAGQTGNSLVFASNANGSAPTENMRIDSAGNVGIGLIAPLAKLHVKTASAVAGEQLIFENGTNVAFSTLYMILKANGVARAALAGQQDGTSSGGTFVLQVADSAGASQERLRVTAAGNVGIGVTAPLAKLHVQNGTNGVLLEPTGTWAAKIYQANDATTNNGLVVGNRWAADTSTVFEAGSLYGTGAGTAWGSYYKISGIGTHTWGTSNSGIATRMVLDNTGNLGIGTATPSALLHVKNASGNNIVLSESGSGYASFQIKSSGTNNAYLFFTNATNNEQGRITVSDTGFMMFSNGNAATERMRIDPNGNVGIGTATSSYKLQVNGSFAATTKSFVIDHPTKPDMKLRYGSLEGPENGVYVRGRLKDSNVIELPDYWTGLVDESTITVNLTAIGKSQDLWVDDIIDNTVIVSGSNVNCFYTVFAERKDVEKLIVEF